MATTRRDGTVLTQVDETEVEIGTVSKDESDWLSECALCETGYSESTKTEAISSLEDHFVKTHTALSI